MAFEQKKLMHAAVIQGQYGEKQYLYLRYLGEHHYAWFIEQSEGNESETGIWAPTILEALQLARKEWRNAYFRTVKCGFRYHLPERDEHGENALFYQMAASYASSTGVYFDELEGHNCIVQNASQEAKGLLTRVLSG